MKVGKSTADVVSSGAMRRHIRGQGLTEYAIIVSLVAIAAIWAASFFGDTIKANFVEMGATLSGGAAYDATAETATARTKAEGTVRTATTLQNYNN